MLLFLLGTLFVFAPRVGCVYTGLRIKGFLSIPLAQTPAREVFLVGVLCLRMLPVVVYV